MNMIKIEDAIGCILSHDVTQIIPGEFKGVAFKKGHIITEEDIEKLLSIGKEHIYVWEQKQGQLHENEAAQRIAHLIKGDGIYSSEQIKEGKINFFAQYDGLLDIDTQQLSAINSLGDIIVSTMHKHTQVKKGEKIAGTKIIPLVIDEKKILDTEQCITKKLISVKEFKHKKCLLITTGNEVYKGRIKDAFLPVMQEKLGYFGSSIIRQVILPDDKDKIIQEITKGIDEQVDIILCTGGMSVDPDDVTPTAIKECGAKLVLYGAPVLPGAMFLLAYYKNIPILGIPSCAMYAKRTILDLVLPRVLAEQQLTAQDIIAYGNGGMCLDCDTCTFPHCSFGK